MIEKSIRSELYPWNTSNSPPGADGNVPILITDGRIASVKVVSFAPIARPIGALESFRVVPQTRESRWSEWLGKD